MDSGADAVTQWLKEEGIHAPLGSVLLVRALRTASKWHARPAALGVRKNSSSEAQEARAKQSGKARPRMWTSAFEFGSPCCGAREEHRLLAYV